MDQKQKDLLKTLAQHLTDAAAVCTQLAGEDTPAEAEPKPKKTTKAAEAMSFDDFYAVVASAAQVDADTTKTILAESGKKRAADIPAAERADFANRLKDQVLG